MRRIKLEQQQKAKANGEEASIAAKNQADSKVLVSDAILALLESLPEVTTELMKPAERIESIRVLDLGGGGNGNGSNGMNPDSQFHCECWCSSAIAEGNRRLQRFRYRKDCTDYSRLCFECGCQCPNRIQQNRRMLIS